MIRLLSNYQFDNVIYRSKNPLHRLELVKKGKDTSLWLNNHFQFSTADEFIYHEPLVTLPMTLAPKIDSVAILGGGDGLALREVLRFPVKKVYLVETDKEIIDLAKSHPFMYHLNNASLYQPLVNIVIDDTGKFIKKPPMKFDVIIADLPSPTGPELEKLFNREFYMDIKNALANEGIFITHIGTTHKKRRAIKKVLGQIFKGVVPLIAPTIIDDNTEWYDYLMVSDKSLDIQREIPRGARWLTYPRILKMITLGQKRTRTRA